MDWLEVEAKLKERALEVAQHLLPNGRREGGEWVCGSLDGQPGRSLKVNVTGKVGVWCDFADSGKSGKTLMSLWCSVRAKPFRDCIEEAKDFLGIRDGFQNPKVTNYPALPVKPDESAWRKVSETWAKCSPLVEGGPVWKYLVDQRRLDPQAIAAYDIRETISLNEWAMVFPYWAAPPMTWPRWKLLRPFPHGSSSRSSPAWMAGRRNGPAPNPRKASLGCNCRNTRCFAGVGMC
jgi:twinkle protein